MKFGLAKFLGAGIAALLLFSCQNDEENPEGEEEFTANYFKEMAGTETGNSEYPYMVQHENGEVMILTAEGDTPTGVIYFVDENTIVEMNFNEEMLPTQVTYNDDAIVLFENYREGLVDLAVVVNDDFQIYRDIEFPTQDIALKSATGKQMANWPQFFSALGTTINAGLCGIAAAATAIPSLGTSVPAAIITCGGALLGTVVLLRPSDSEAMNNTASTVGVVANAYGCAGGLAQGPLAAAANCINSMIDAAGLFSEYKDDLVQLVNEVIAAAQGGLQTGDGDVKFTLTWDNDTDLDLYVTEPSGDTIWYGSRFSTTGGELDRDDLDGFGPENIFWPTDFAIPGEYLVEVRMFSGNKSTTFRVKPKLGENNFYPSVVFGIESDGQTVFVGRYILSAGDSGKMAWEWRPAAPYQQSFAENLYRPKNKK